MLIAFKLKLALVCAAGLAGPLAVAPLLNDAGAPDAGLRDRQAFVELQPGTASYRVAGDFTRAGKQVASPLVTVRLDAPLTIMKHQTSSANYQRESGPRARPMDPEWVSEIEAMCRRSGTAFFFKQWGGKNKKAAGRMLNGRTYDEMPTAHSFS